MRKDTVTKVLQSAHIVDAAAGWTEQFTPRRFLRSGHLQTLAGNFLPRNHPGLPTPESRIIEVEPAKNSLPASHVLCECHWQPQPVRSTRPTLILLHGLEGSAQSQYVVGNAARAWAAGCNVVRMNMRNCGGTEKLSPTLYHSGFSNDVRVVMETFAAEYLLENVALVGYSMGGNLVLKLGGELGAGPPGYLKTVVGVSPAMDLAASADALHEPWNRVYEWKFLRGLLQRYKRKVSLFPQIYKISSLKDVRTLRQFDDRITAAYSGFTGADDYYARSSSAQMASQITVPTLIMHALDDPFVRMLPATRAALLGNEHVTLFETQHGGHCAFLGPAIFENELCLDDGYWAEKMLLRFIMRSS
jgi:predicted alpha/beta-fold hydrolase